jgi:Asp-tRNA(Asn)/Glu-tRNA(Gln) amidotransferase A subunit family amidase
MAFEAARAYAYEHDAHRAKLSAQLVQLVEAGQAIRVDDYIAARRTAAAARHALAAVFKDWDVLLAPSAAGEAPEGLAATGDPVFSRMWTLLHVPCLSLPAQPGPRGLPLGLQAIAPWGDDARLFACANWIAPRIAPKA